MPSKMARPMVPARVEKWCQFLGGLVAASDIWTFVRITMQARKCQVGGDREAIVLFCDDVIYLKRNGIAVLSHEAVFARGPGASPHQVNKRCLHDWIPRTLLLSHFLEGSTRLGVKYAEQTTGIRIVAQL